MSRRQKDPLRELTAEERQQLLQLSRSQSAPAVEAIRAPTPEADGTASWSLATLQRTLRSAPDGLPRVSTYTIRRVLHEAGASFQRTRSWCPTGAAVRRRKAGPAVVTDPDAAPKKSGSRTPTRWGGRWGWRSW